MLSLEVSKKKKNYESNSTIVQSTLLHPEKKLGHQFLTGMLYIIYNRIWKVFILLTNFNKNFEIFPF